MNRLEKDKKDVGERVATIEKGEDIRVKRSEKRRENDKLSGRVKRRRREEDDTPCLRAGL